MVIYVDNKKLYRNSEELLRINQYRRYMKNRDHKFDFMDLGVMERFPFPEIE